MSTDYGKVIVTDIKIPFGYMVSEEMTWSVHSNPSWVCIPTVFIPPHIDPIKLTFLQPSIRPQQISEIN